MIPSGPNQAGGAKFAAAIRGNSQQAENLDAALRALPGGDEIATGFGRFLDVMEATGQRQTVGSRTSFNAVIRAEMTKGGPAKEGASLALGAGIKLPERVMRAFDDWQAGRNVEQLARLFTDRSALAEFQRLARIGDTRSVGVAAARIATIADRGARSSTTEPKAVEPRR